MKERGSPGHIFIVNSILGKKIPDVSVPMYGTYPASKYALTGLAEVVRKELMYFKLPVRLTVSPIPPQNFSNPKDQPFRVFTPAWYKPT